MSVKEPKDKVPYVLDMLYPPAYLDEPSSVEGVTNRQMQAEVRKV